MVAVNHAPINMCCSRLYRMRELIYPFPIDHTFASVAHECVSTFFVCLLVLRLPVAPLSISRVETQIHKTIRKRVWLKILRIVVDWKSTASHCSCAKGSWWNRAIAQTRTGPVEPNHIVTEIQPEFQWVTYRRVITVIPLRPSPQICIIVFPSWFPKLIIVSTCLLIAYHIFL